MAKKVVVMPCSGIGKAYGEIARQAAYELEEDLRPGDVTTACLARLMIETTELIKNNFVITLDGCAKDCAKKNVEFTGKTVDEAIRVINTFKEHRELKPQGVLELGEPGKKLAHILAEKVAPEVDCLLGKE